MILGDENLKITEGRAQSLTVPVRTRFSVTKRFFGVLSILHTNILLAKLFSY